MAFSAKFLLVTLSVQWVIVAGQFRVAPNEQKEVVPFNQTDAERLFFGSPIRLPGIPIGAGAGGAGNCASKAACCRWQCGATAAFCDPAGDMTSACRAAATGANNNPSVASTPCHVNEPTCPGCNAFTCPTAAPTACTMGVICVQA